MTRIDSPRLTRAALVFILGLGAASTEAQEVPSPAWHWTADGNVFFGYNYQQRLYADFSAWESQNWLMGSGERQLGNGRLTIESMISLEPFTLSAEGSPQLFQTGETYQQIPIVNRQHPHDLVMGLGGTYRYNRGGTTLVFGADLVGSPTLGPVPFMHRESARNNPQVPITHHFMDSAHVSTGVVRAGVETGGFTFEGSVFRGAEPDEDRTNIERPALNSWAGRIGYRRGSWSAQFSAGHIKEPEWFEPYDHTRLTASVAFNGTVAGRRLNATLGWGENREKVVINGVSDGYLLEWDFAPSARTALYGRAEIALKQLFGLGFHPRGFEHPHVYSHLDTLTIGAVRDIINVRRTRVGIGADVTLYHMSPDLLQYYDGSHSYHIFLRWRPNAAPTGHVH
jgi:hypothetical protein